MESTTNMKDIYSKSDNTRTSTYVDIDAVTRAQFNRHPSGFDPTRPNYSQDNLTDNHSCTDVTIDAQNGVARSTSRHGRVQQIKNDSLSKKRRYAVTEMSVSCENERHSSRSSCCNTCSLIVIAILVLTFAAVATVALFYAITLQTRLEDLQTKFDSLHTAQSFTEQKPTLCLPCTDVQQGPLPEDTPELNSLVKGIHRGLCLQDNQDLFSYNDIFTELHLLFSY